jgi:hypothetical protein
MPPSGLGRYIITGYLFAQKNNLQWKRHYHSGVENVFVAAVQEWSDDFMEKVWYAYLVNDSDFLIESVIVSKHLVPLMVKWKKHRCVITLVEIPAVSVWKLRWSEKRFAANNEFMVTFSWNKLYDKVYFLRPAQHINETTRRRSLFYLLEALSWRELSNVIIFYKKAVFEKSKTAFFSDWYGRPL